MELIRYLFKNTEGSDAYSRNYGYSALKQADGEQGYTALPGYYTLTMLNAKIKRAIWIKLIGYCKCRIYSTTFIPVDNRNPRP